nr:serine hydrolase [Pseudonocardia sp. ICBG601]
MPVTLDPTAQILRDAVATGCVPGLVAAVDHPRHGTGVHVLGDDGAGHPLRRDTIVRIASVTKPVVAVAALAPSRTGCSTSTSRSRRGCRSSPRRGCCVTRPPGSTTPSPRAGRSPCTTC